MLDSLCKCLFGPSGSGQTAGEDKDPEAASSKEHLPQTDGKREQLRIVRANDRAFNAKFKYADNYIKTSKYTLLTFVPCNLYQQFTRIANFYFLVLLFLQCIPQIASVSWVYTLIPLGFVLSCSAVKDAFDDLQRHHSDRQVNSRISFVVRNSRLEMEKWMEVRVGDIIRMENEHFIAADLLLLSSSEPHGLCYIETAELDGETNLKTRAALAETVPLDDRLRNISEFDGEIFCEPPNNRLDHFEGRLEWRGKVIPVDNRNMLLRGCRLRNTRWCYGLVVFAGKDTKLMQNSGQATLKRTSLDKFLNLLILGIVLFLLAMCLICTLMAGIWEHAVGRYFRPYLPWDEFVANTKQALTLPNSRAALSDDDTSSSFGPSQAIIIAALQFFSYMILLNTVVPISLYISVEMIRLAHSKFINGDAKMYDEKTDTPARARTSTLNEELGQVQYVFSDKTGTLTQNIMLFKKCSINGRSYGDVMTDRGEIVEDVDDGRTPPLDFSANRWYEPSFRFYDKTLKEDTRIGIREVHQFWRLLAICHTVMPERKPGNVLEYQAQSPDEAALTSAARNFGFVFKSRTPQSITVEVDGKEETYEMLHILDFDNVRKRMSVLVRSHSGQITLYSKGADTMILERLSARDTSELLRAATLQHLDKFATEGLRTLCVAYKPNLDPVYCEQWMVRLKEARLDATRKEELVDALYEEMERDMLLLGATAIEDKLQDGVPQTIATLATANIKIWVLTGDKTETAINIGYSCRLLTEDMREVFVIDGKEEKEVEVQLKDIKRRIAQAKGTQLPQQRLPGAASVSSYYSANMVLAAAIAADFASPKKPTSAAPVSRQKRKMRRRMCPLASASALLGGGTWTLSSEEEDEQKGPVAKYIQAQIAALERAEQQMDTGEAKGERRKSVFGEQIRTTATGRERERQLAAELTTKVVGVNSFYPSPRSPLHHSPPPAAEQSPRANPPTTVVITEPTTFPAHNGTTETTAPNGVLLVPNGKQTNGDVEAGGQQQEGGGGDGSYALVINGEALAHALKRKYEKTFLEIGTNCVSVICCRVTPLQKAQVVDLVKRNVKAVTLAIGDGANDVSMIRTAHIGVGISGQEGMQAVLSSDFSIGQFRFLERLLLVHGRWSYLRMCKFLRYFFYKNFAFTLPHFWFSFFCGFSAQTVYDPLLISLYNLMFTAMPVLSMGIFDQDVSEEYSIRFPRLYIPGQFNLFFNMRIFIYSVIQGMISSLVLFFVPFGTLFHAISAHGLDMNDYSMLAFTTFTALVLVVTGQIAFDTAYWTWINWLVVVGSLLSYLVTVVTVYQLIPVQYLPSFIDSAHLSVAWRAASYPPFWLSIVLICAILLVPMFANRFFWFATHPSYADRLRVRYRLCQQRGAEPEPEPPGAGKAPARTPTARKSRRGSLRSGYAFSHSAGFGELIAKGTLFKNMEHLRIPSLHRGAHTQDGSSSNSETARRSPRRRFSLLPHSPSPLPPLVENDAHHQHRNAPPHFSHQHSIQIEPVTSNGAEDVVASSVTQFSPGSSNTTTTTAIKSDPSRKAQKKFPTHSSGAPKRPASNTRREGVESLVIEHPSVESADALGEEEEEEDQEKAQEEQIGPSITRIPVHEGGDGGWPVASAAVVLPLQPSPELLHNLVVNVDGESPLPSNWIYNPDEGTVHLPVTDSQQQPTPSLVLRSDSHPQSFVHKKRRKESMESSTSESNGERRRPSKERRTAKTTFAAHGNQVFPGEEEQQHESKRSREQQKRVFTGKMKRPDTTANNKRNSNGETASGSGEKIDEETTEL